MVSILFKFLITLSIILTSAYPNGIYIQRSMASNLPLGQELSDLENITKSLRLLESGLLDAFVKAIQNVDDPEAIQAFINSIGVNQIAIESVFEALLSANLQLDRPFDETNSMIELELARLQSHSVPSIDFGSRIFESILFNVSFVALLFSISGFEYGNFYTELPDWSTWLATLTLVNTVRQFSGFKQGFKSFLSRLNRQNEARIFLQELKVWISKVKSNETMNDQMDALVLSAHMNSTLLLSSSRVQEADRLAMLTQTIITKLKSEGLWGKWNLFLQNKRLKNICRNLIPYVSDLELVPTVRGLNSQHIQIMRYGDSTVRLGGSLAVANLVKRWLDQVDEIQKNNLRTALISELNIVQNEDIVATRFKLIDHVIIQALTVTAIGLSLAVAVSTGSSTYLENFLPDSFINFSRNNQTIIALAATFFPAIALLLFEAEYNWNNLKNLVINKNPKQRRLKIERLKVAIETVERHNSPSVESATESLSSLRDNRSTLSLASIIEQITQPLSRTRFKKHCLKIFGFN